MLTIEEYETRAPSLNMRVGEISLIRRIFSGSNIQVCGKDQVLAESILPTDGGLRTGFPLILIDELAKMCAIARAEGAQEERLRLQLKKPNASE